MRTTNPGQDQPHDADAKPEFKDSAGFGWPTDGTPGATGTQSGEANGGLGVQFPTRYPTVGATIPSSTSSYPYYFNIGMICI